MLHAFLGAMLAATSVGITARVLKDADACARPSRGSSSAPRSSTTSWACSSWRWSRASSRPLHRGGAVRRLRGLDRGQGGCVPDRSAPGRLADLAAAVPRRACAPEPRCGAWRSRSGSASSSPTSPSGRVWRRSWARFAAGLVLEDVHFEGHVQRGEPPLHESLEPLTALLVPVFFIRMGMLVDLRSFASASVLGFAGLAHTRRDPREARLRRRRAEGGLRAHAGPGHDAARRGRLDLRGHRSAARLAGRPVVDAGTYAAAVFMVVATTMLTPPLLLWSIRRH